MHWDKGVWVNEAAENKGKKMKATMAMYIQQGSNLGLDWVRGYADWARIFEWRLVLALQLQAGINDRSRKRKCNSKCNGKGPWLRQDSSYYDDSTTDHSDNLQGGGDGVYTGLEGIVHGH
ncbi:hypothetical protein Pyn_27899 [Prunus yedoensis var. nudiflora]|uniref:Uncharacterized protein n=1 Tax=Prunus yedoensis var. nudiflora TaxID=2094558 RepID=A0A314ZD75_PRUYE|nr:hypothetical protein Pyn_27899 [Prunus yedoensis var. nudiflora]